MLQKTVDGELRRKLELFPATNIVISNMIGAGIFTTSGLLLADLESPVLMLLVWIAGGLLALCGALCYGYLGRVMPQAGGEYIFLSRLYHPLAGFLSGWVSFVVGFSAPVAAASIGCSEYLTAAFPALGNWGGLIPALGVTFSRKALSILVILVVTIIHLKGVEFGARIQSLFTWMEVVLIAGLIVAGFIWGRGSFEHFTYSFPAGLAGWKTAGLALVWVMFAYSGWNASTYIASEIVRPARNLPRSLLLGAGTVMLLYVVVNAFYVFALTPGEMKGVISIGSRAAGAAFGQWMVPVFSLLIAMALFSSLSAFTILGPRVSYSMARDGYFFRFASHIDPVLRIPSRAIKLQAALSILMVVSGTFDQLLTYLGFSLGIFPILAVAGIFKLNPPEDGSRRFAGYPFVPLIFIASFVSMLILTFLQRPVESSLALATVLAGIPAFLIFRRNRTRSIRSEDERPESD